MADKLIRSVPENASGIDAGFGTQRFSTGITAPREVAASLGFHNPRLIFVDITDAKVSITSSFLGNQDAFGSSNNRQAFGVDLSDEQWGAMPNYMIIVSSPPCIDQEQPVAMGDPMGLRVVTA